MHRLSWIHTTGLIAIMVMSSFFAEAQFGFGRRQESQAENLMRQGDFAGALAVYNELIERAKTANEDATALLNRRAYCLYSLGRHDEALKDIDQYLAKYNDRQAVTLRAYIYGALDNTDAQLHDIDALLQADPYDTDILKLRAQALMDAGRYTDAQRDIKKLVSVEPTPEAKAYLGLSHYYLDQPDSALIIFDEVIASDPAYAPVYLYAGSVALEAGSHALALKYIEQGLRIDPSNTTLLFYKGVALVQQENETQGCRCLTKAFAAGEDEAAGYLKQYCYGVE